MASGDKLIIPIDGDASPLKKTLGGLGGIAGSALGATVGAIGAVSTALAGAGVASVTMASEFESSMAMVSTLFGDVAVNAQKLDSDMLALSTSTGYSAKEMGDSLYNALSAGVPATEDMGEALIFMEKSAKLAKGAGAELGSVVDAQTSIMNAYKMEASDLDKVQKILIQTQNKGKTTVAELSASLAQVTPTAAAMGVSFDQVGAALSSMTAQGTPTAQATTQLNSLFAELGKSGTVASKALEEASAGTEHAGKSFQKMADEGVPLSEILDLLGTHAEKSGLSMLDMFGSIEAGKAALSLSGENTEGFIANIEAMGTAADVVGSAYDTMSNTFKEQSSRMLEGLKNLGIGIVMEQDNLLSNVAGFGNELVGNLTSAFQEGGLDGLVTELGNSFAMIVTKIAENGPAMIETAIGLISSFIEGIRANQETITTGATELITTFVNGIIVLVPELMLLGLDIIMAIVLGISENLPEFVTSAISMIDSLIEGILANLDPLLEAALNIIITLALGLVGAIPTLVEAIPKIISAIISAFLNNLGKIIETAISIIGALASGLIMAIPELLLAIPRIILAIVGAFLKHNWLQLGKDVINGIVKGIVNSGKAFIDAIINICKNALGSIKRFFGIQSPSRVMRKQVGEMLGKGLAIGVKESTKFVVSEVSKQNKEVKKTVSDGFSEIAKDKGINPLADQVLEVLLEMGSVIRDYMPEIIEAGKDILLAVIEGVLDESPEIAKKLPDVIDKIAGVFTEKKVDMVKTGADLIKNIWQGVKENSSWLTSNVSKMINGITSKVENGVALAGKRDVYKPKNTEAFDDLFGDKKFFDFDSIVAKAEGAVNFVLSNVKKPSSDDRAINVNSTAKLYLDGEEITASTSKYQARNNEVYKFQRGVVPV